MKNNMTSPNFDETWGAPLHGLACERCNWSYLAPEGSQPKRCPYCLRGALAPVAQSENLLVYPPEMALPFTVQALTLRTRIEAFADKIPFAPKDLSAQNLRARLKGIYLPAWLVDAEMQALWQGEVGFNYEVVSHQDSFDDGAGGWRSREVKRTRQRWEPRVGRLARTYHNIPAPALDEEAALRQKVGDYKLEDAQAYQPTMLGKGLVRLPNRSPDDAWPDAIPNLHAAATEECRRAASADHARDFRWNANYANQNWTHLLLPLYVTYYLDDDNVPQRVLIHGQTGRVNGVRRASRKRANTAALWTLLAAVLIFFVGLGLSLLAIAFPPIGVVGGGGILLAFVVGLGAVIPPWIAWNFNRRER